MCHYIIKSTNSQKFRFYNIYRLIYTYCIATTWHTRNVGINYYALLTQWLLCDGQLAMVSVQVFKREFHTHIYLD